MIDEQSSASEHDCALDRSAIGAGAFSNGTGPAYNFLSVSTGIVTYVFGVTITVKYANLYEVIYNEKWRPRAENGQTFTYIV